MKSVVASLLVVGASAFVPASQKVSSTALNVDGFVKPNMEFANEIGAQAPLGLYDPLQMLSKADQAEFDRLRWVELKHGRVAMLAVVGYLVTYAGVRFPGAEDIPAGFAAWGALPPMVVVQMIATWAAMEMANSNRPATLNGFKAEFQGDFRNGALDFGWDKQSDAWKKNKRTIEINNGRAAMMGILGLMVHEEMGNIDVILPW